ncbi:MAG: hypothetical protein JJU22_03405 [Gammaproteobacteria bacterium]|nr:hypothetical protein [Gammaproteobacteria bacterium]
MNAQGRNWIVTTLGTLTGWMLLMALPASAHHGWSANDTEIELSGTLETGVSLSGPHGTMQIRDVDGELWDITLAPAPRTHRAGLREGTVPVGDTVTVHGQRSADADRREIKVRRVTWNGQHFDVYPPPRS